MKVWVHVADAGVLIVEHFDRSVDRAAFGFMGVRAEDSPVDIPDAVVARYEAADKELWAAHRALKAHLPEEHWD